MTLAQPAELAVPPDAACLDCGYSLQHLTVPRCPECGHPFNPHDPRSMRTGNSLAFRFVAAVAPTSLFVAVTLGLAIGILAVQSSVTPWTWVPPGAAICLGAIAGLAVRSFVRSHLRRSLVDPARLSDRRWTSGLMVAFALWGLYLGVDRWSCWHSSAWGVGPYELVWTNDLTCRSDRLPHSPRHPITTHIAWYDYRETLP